MVAILGTSVPAVYAAAQTTSTYTVQSGDTLWKIAQTTGVSITQLEQANNITNPNLLQVGQVLTIPSTGTSTGQATTYTVKSGETLWKISQATGVSMQAIVQANNLTNPNQLSVGQVLTIPSSSTSTTGGTTAPTTSTTYTVKSGDTLWKIAQATGVTVQAIVQANGITNPDQISVGQVLTIPASGNSTPSSAPTSYTVKAGDTLSKIAQETGTSVAGIVQVNHLNNPNYLYVGQILILPPTALNITASFGQNLIVNDSQDNPGIKVVVTDSTGHPFAAAEVSATVANTSIANVTGAPSTDNNGVTYIPIKPGSSTGTTTVTVSCDGFTTTIPVTTVNQPKTIILTGTPGQIVANSNTQVPFSVKVEDANGAPLAGIPIIPDFSGTASLTTTANGAIVTNAQGNATFDVIQDGGSTGTSLVSATVPGNLVYSAQQVPVTVTNGAQSVPSDPIATVNVSAASTGTIGIGQPMQINVTALDAHGNPVKFSPSDVQYQISPPNPNQPNTGSVDPTTGEFTASANGQYQIRATVDGINSQNYATVSVYGVPAGISLGPDSSWQMVDDPNSTQTMQIRVTDSTDLGVPNQTVTLTSDNPNVATTSSQTVTTDAYGDATVSLVPGTSTGTAHITATVNGNVTATTTIQVTSQPGKITVTADSPTLVANTNQQTTVHVVGTNTDGSPAAGDVVKFTETPSLIGGWLSSVGALAGDGTANITVYPVGNPGTVTLTASIGQVSGSTSIDVIPGVDASHSSDFVPSTLQLGKSNDILDVMANDATGKPVLNLNYQAFTLVLTSGTQSITVPATDVIMDNNGAAGYTPEFTPKSQGVFTSGATVTAQLFINGVAIGTSKSVTLS